MVEKPQRFITRGFMGAIEFGGKLDAAAVARLFHLNPTKHLDLSALATKAPDIEKAEPLAPLPEDSSAAVTWTSNATAEQAREAAASYVLTRKPGMEGLVGRYETMVKSTYGEGLGRFTGLTREEYDAQREKVLAAMRQELEQDYNFKGGEIITDENGKPYLGAWTMFYHGVVHDKDGKEYPYSATLSGGGRTPVDVNA